MSLSDRREAGSAIVEFAMVLPALIMVVSLAVMLTSVLVDRLRMQELAATAARVIARGDPVPAQLQAEVDALGTMTVSLTSQYLTVEVRRRRTVLRHAIELTARSVARTEVSTNDFEQD
jgi:hypothetical protein